jgi:hypothetical protein
MSRLIIFLTCLVALSGCVGPPKSRSGSGIGSERRPVAIVDADTRQCTRDLDRLGSRYTLVADRDFGGGCQLSGAVQLLGADVPIANVTAIRCPLAKQLTRWVREVVQPAATDSFGSRVTRIESMGSYACRNIVGGSGGGRSQHATGNAVDIGVFLLADGRRVSVRQGWQGTSAERKFLRNVSKDGCRYFQTVLGPDYNAAHFDHLHFDLGGRPFCR